MVASLPLATALASLPMLALGILFLWGGDRWRRVVQAAPRSQALAVVTFGIGGLWFLWKITQLGPSDFGDYKRIFLVAFGVAWAGSFLYRRDFLAVRGLAVLVLLLGWEGLKSAFGHWDASQRLVLVVLIYLLVLCSLWLGAAPFRLRDFLDWVYARRARTTALGIICGVWGLALALTALTY